VRTTIDLAHSLGLRLVAEGVETDAHLRELARLGGDLAQGYHLSRPLPPDDLTPWLQQRIRQPTSHHTPESSRPSSQPTGSAKSDDQARR
jgi:sensor c-di-GMP phosphodiesterase-like protein